MLDAAESESFAKHWAAAWNERDVEAVLAHFAEDCIFTSPVARQLLGGDGVIIGKQALREYWVHALEKVPDLHFEVLGVHSGIDTVVIHYRNQRGVEVCEVLTFRADGLVHLGHGTYRGTSGNPAGAR
ncbi:MAG TPA: nuclear transport factor 2 family protein [Sporichthya sp.]|nr:nuclear transport factor 2 family protein [Sporichthya sp.]